MNSGGQAPSRADYPSIEPRRLAASSGFSVVELLIVVVVVAILTGITIFALSPAKRGYGPEDAALRVMSFLREAHQRAMSERQSMLVRVDLPNRQIILIDENTLAAGDEREVKRAYLEPDVRMEQPLSAGSPIQPPPAPFNFPAAAYTSGVWEGRFTAEGSLVDTTPAPAPLSATFFFWPVNPNDTVTPTPRAAHDVRGVTVFGPSGSLRYWRHDGTQFIAESR